MDIEKLIEKANHLGMELKRDGGEFEYSIGKKFLEYATALSTLQAENEKLRAELEQVKEDWSTAANGLMLMQKKLNKVYRMLYDPLIIVDGGHLRPVKNTSRQQVYKKLVDLQVEMGINRGFPWGEMRMEKKED